MHRPTRSILLLGMAAMLLPMGPAPASAEIDDLRSFVAKKAGIVQLLHNKAERALVTSAQDEAYRLYFEADTDEQRAEIRARIDRIGLAVQQQFAVEEMCLIDETGTEISRIVGREIAYDLSNEEASANFFAPTFAAPNRTVYLAPIYMSPDAHRWVTAYATPIEVQGGKKKAILHYEHGLDFYEKVLEAGVEPGGKRGLLTVTKDGWVIFDSRRDISIEQVGDAEAEAVYFKQAALDGLSFADLKKALGSGPEEGSGTVATPKGSYDVAYKAMGDWTLIAFEPAAVGG